MSQTRYQRPRSQRLLVERLPDGSAAVFDTTSEAVHSLNQTAALVWECCAEPSTLDDIAAAVQRATGVTDARAAVEDGLAQLVRVGLVEAIEGEQVREPSRRAAMGLVVGGASIAFVAPLVLTLTVAEQNVHAQQAGSPTPTPTAAPEVPTGSPTPTGAGTPTNTPTPTDTPTPTNTPTTTTTPTPTNTPTLTTTPTPTNTPTATPIP